MGVTLSRITGSTRDVRSSLPLFFRGEHRISKRLLMAHNTDSGMSSHSGLPGRVTKGRILPHDSDTDPQSFYPCATSSVSR
jgi:hypothetical protein